MGAFTDRYGSERSVPVSRAKPGSAISRPPGSGELHGNAVVGSAVLGEDPVGVGDGAVEPDAGASPDVLAGPFQAAVGHRPAGEPLDPPGGLAILEQLR